MRQRVFRASAPEQRQEQRQPLLDKCLSGKIAHRLSTVALLGDRKRRRKREIGILGLLGKLVMLQVIRTVAGKVGADRERTEPLPGPFIDRLVAVNSTLSGF